ncbi:MAG TPA: acetyl-CoA C-acyltransferase [Chitinophagales bacterium]|nr:acetyl-CoA C-acyltransferase [Chitinophagales bacterium]HMW13151.1 acetyl-CoA C-acyltransferase [Chitinophagales bacterium]HMX60870.1 acetyl-CoA C-acyltransferase [Chitinophagales bacterium]HMY22508.1 acetyl-CoA C-acyltransferase [Chitinophagales bacterium]HMZ34508.1 acetyl-CoA C-acyltransferase [Chitinophagales bacterium]
MQEVFIVSMARTPIGALSSTLSGLNVIELGKTVVKAAMERAGVNGDQIDEVYLGNVLQANVGQAPAQQVSIAAGINTKTPCTTINKVCASGMKAIMLGAQSIMLGDNHIVVVGGMESMSNAPHYLPSGRTGIRYGNGEILDAISRDGLQDPYKKYMMGNAGEVCAKHYSFTREDQDAYAIASYKRAQDAYANGYFKDEIIPVVIASRKGDITISEDEEYKKFDEAKVSALKPAFEKEGTITAINASKINDGASAMVLMSGDKVKELGLTPLAKIISFADASQEPEWFTTTPSKAIPKALQKANLTTEQVDFYEINEAFSVVALANMKEMNIAHDKINVFGGAVALGHPIGSSGCRIVATLISVLKNKNGKIGAAGICNGGGGASAIVIEKV